LETGKKTRRTKMGWFNVLKGAYPSLQQIDKTLDVAAGESGIVRGSLIYQDGATFKLATATQSTDAGAYIFFALQAQTDLVAGMAGSVGQGVAGGVARITGLAVGMPAEFETSEFDISEAYAVGDLLTVGANGELVPHTAGKNVVAQVTKPVTTRWVNDAVAVTGYRTGANVSVISGRTMWIPIYG
jgi:hypothetical protein